MVRRWNGRGIWKVRPMPLLIMRYGGAPAISAPANSMDPADGASVPESMLKIVLLPEPFGPIRPSISPRSTLNDTLLTAVKPPKRFTNPLTTSTSRSPVGPEKAGLLIAERGSLRQRQHGLALHLALRPYHIRLVIDVLQHDRERAFVLAGHLGAVTKELDAVAEHGAAFGDVGIERRLTERFRINT